MNDQLEHVPLSLRPRGRGSQASAIGRHDGILRGLVNKDKTLLCYKYHVRLTVKPKLNGAGAYRISEQVTCPDL